MWRSASAPSSTLQKNSPRFTSGPTSCSANSNSVTTPKLPPPPRSAQCRSAFSAADAVTTRAVGGDDARRHEVVAAQAVLARQPADPAAEAQAGDAGVADHAARHGQTVLLRGRVEIGPGCAAAAARAARAGVDGDTSRIALRSIIRPSSTTPWPAKLWPPPRTAISRSCSRANPIAAATSSRGSCARDQCGAAVDVAVPQRAGFVVTGVTGDEQLAARSACGASRVRSRRAKPSRDLLDRGAEISQCRGADRLSGRAARTIIRSPSASRITPTTVQNA